MKRLCVFSIFDPEGQVDAYIYYWLKEFKSVCDRIIVVSNGDLKKCHQLTKYADDVIERNNTGFDGGAYADVLTKYLSYEEIQEFDEIALCNDTCYGPFVPMKEIFNEMNAKENDFWGIQLWDEGYAKWINSFFIVFRKRIITDIGWYSYFKDRIDQGATHMSEAYGNYEMGLNLWLEEQGYVAGYYASPIGMHNMKCPDYFVEKYRFPFLKKRSFCMEHYHEDNLQRAMALIRKTGYDLSLILRNVSRKYDISDELLRMEESTERDEQCLVYDTKEYSVDRAVKTPEEIIGFIIKNADKDMYIYGAGAFGSRIYLVYRKYMKNCKGFILSRKDMDTVLGAKVYVIDEIDLDRSAIIIGMDKKNTEEVLRENLNEAKNVLNLYEESAVEEIS